MLYLRRRIGERIRIGDDIEVVVSRVEGRQVQVGIKAPRDMKIVRTELESPIPNLTRLGLPDDASE